MNDLMQRLRTSPVRPFPCRGCRHLREANSPKFSESAVVCGFYDALPRPIAPLAMLPDFSDGRMGISRKQAFGPHTDEPPLECPAFEPISDDYPRCQSPEPQEGAS